MNEQQIRQIIREELKTLLKSDRYTFEKTIQILDGRNIQLGKTTGTIIGTQATQKIGFFGKAPVVRHAVGGASTAGGTYTSTEQNMLQALWDALRAYGLLS